MPTEKSSTSYRLSADCRELLQQLAEALGINQTAVIEQAVRRMARAELPAPQPEQAKPAKPTSKRKPKKAP